ncbi:MAG: aldo/keto reductase [Cyanobacteria bacterium]|nr:aldo/keto reductase [Cyanobacteriota bacterium]
MKFRELGNTGLKVSELGFGCWGIGGNAFGNSYGNTDDSQSLEALNLAWDLGCNFFETSNAYGHGHSETLLGKAMAGWNRDEAIIATKVGQDFWSLPETVRPNFSEKHIREALEASLQRLGTDYIDVYQLENPSMELIHLGRMFQLMATLQQEGKIRFYGISIHDPMEGVIAIEKGQVQTVQTIYNLFVNRPDNPLQGGSLLETCQKNQVGFIAREPLSNGFLTGKFSAETRFETGDFRAKWPKLYIQKKIQATGAFLSRLPEGYAQLTELALKYVLAQPGVSTVIPGCKTPEQVRQNLGVTSLPDLTHEHVEQLKAIGAQLF